MGGVKGNKNAMRHGKIAFLATGRAPKGCGYLFRLIGQLRRNLEGLIQAKYGELSIYHACLAQSVTRHEGRVLLAQRWLAQRADVMNDSDRLAYLREIGAATNSRDAVLKQIGLDKAEAGDVISAIYSAVDEAKLYSDLPEQPEPPEQPSGNVSIDELVESSTAAWDAMQAGAEQPAAPVDATAST